MAKLFEELKRRNVIRVAIAYIATAWLLIQVVETLFPVYGLSDNAIRLVVAVVAVGFVPALIAAWVFELTRRQEPDRRVVRGAHAAGCFVRGHIGGPGPVA